MQPLLLWNARISQNASRPLLLLMIPATLVATPLGQLTGEQVLALALALAGLDTDTDTDTGPAGPRLTRTSCKGLAACL